MVSASNNQVSNNEKIIAQALHLFRNRGYKKTTVSDIAHGCKISKKTLYEIFASKEDILHVVLWHESSKIMEKFNNTLLPDSPPDKHLLLFCRYLLAEKGKGKEPHFFWTLEIDDAVIRQAAYGMITSGIAAIYEDGSTQGVFKPVDSNTAAVIVVSLLKTAFHHVQFRDDRYTMFNEVLAMIADAVSPAALIEFAGFKIDYYRILRIHHNATQDEIKRAFRNSAKRHHPDMTEDDETTSASFLRSKEAYETLSDQVKKAAYDNFLAALFSGDSDSYSYEFLYKNE